VQFGRSIGSDDRDALGPPPRLFSGGIVPLEGGETRAKLIERTTEQFRCPLDVLALPDSAARDHLGGRRDLGLANEIREAGFVGV
jgi:hypothetical protein